MRTPKQRKAAKRNKRIYMDARGKFNPTSEFISQAVEEYLEQGGIITQITQEDVENRSSLDSPINRADERDTATFLNNGQPL